ncbi:hypothetical protein BDN72DRAFT_217524 [Pluteus cervinus]|uniref:Uncharacterized protein n=1 Tax=Pluteus cervinus TaxID=181527 RepID=A0ACD3AGS1_9AGAR|nr:hypothetical protein BDN72DRAFT_217524 [Pluteus cervinus]
MVSGQGTLLAENVLSTLSQHMCWRICCVKSSEFDFKLGSSYRIPLGQSIEDSNDIRTFLQESFDEICRKRRKPERKAMSIIDRPWPSKEEIEKLVDRASGQFIFPATVIKVIDNKMEDPVKMLNRVLERQTPSFEAIDSLYLVILERVEEQIHLVLQEKPRAAERCQLMRDLLLHVNTHPSSSRDIANFWFEEEVTTIDILVANMQAVLVRDEDTGLIHFRHQSFHDFLVHPSEPPHAFSVANMNPVSRFFLSLRMLAAKSRPPIPKGSFSLPIGALQYLEYAYLYYGGHPVRLPPHLLTTLSSTSLA